MSGWVTVDQKDAGDKGCMLSEAFRCLGEALILAFRAQSLSPIISGGNSLLKYSDIFYFLSLLTSVFP